jgi:molybdopterin molybdotransferase
MSSTIQSGGSSADLYRSSLIPQQAVEKLIGLITGNPVDEEVNIADAVGRYLAHDLIAPTDLPASNNAAVDGYAIDAEIIAGNPDHSFPVVGRAAAGHPFTQTLAAGSAVRIFTGAIMPIGANAVAMHEFCDFDAGTSHVRLKQQIAVGANNRPAGENLRKGEVIIKAGTRLGTADIGIAAAAGFARLQTKRRLTIALISMGDEIIEPGNAPKFGQLHDSNRPMLAAMLADDGYMVRDFGIIPDNADALTGAYRTALDGCDAVLSSGGASDGDEDHTQAAMAALAIEPAFWRLAIKPGRPMSAGVLGGKPLLCLPGNPVAAFVCYRLVAAQVLTALAGGMAKPVMRLPVAAGFNHRKSVGRLEYLRVRLEIASDGTPVMQLHGRKGAGVLSSLTGAHGLVELPVDNDGVSVGDYLSFIPFRESGL